MVEDVTITPKITTVAVSVNTPENSCDVNVAVVSPVINVQVNPTITAQPDFSLAQRVVVLENLTHIKSNEQITLNEAQADYNNA